MASWTLKIQGCENNSCLALSSIFSQCCAAHSSSACMRLTQLLIAELITASVVSLPDVTLTIHI